MEHKKIDFYSEVKVSDHAETPEIRGKYGAVASIGEENGKVLGYGIFVEINNIEEYWEVDKDDITPTGKMFKRSDFYDGSSLGVTPDGEVTRVDIKGQESE